MINSINYMIPDKFSQHICPGVPLELTRKLPPGAPNALLEIAGAARHVEHRVRFPGRGEPRAQRGKFTAVVRETPPRRARLYRSYVLLLG